MTCQQCGKPLATGQLYCENCGAEYCIVPDFEPELETSMAQSLSGLGEEAVEEEKDGKEEGPAKTGRVLFLAAGLLLIAAAAFFFFYRSSLSYPAGKVQNPTDEGHEEEAALPYHSPEEPGTDGGQPEEAEMWIPAANYEGGNYEEHLDILLTVSVDAQIHYLLDSGGEEISGIYNGPIRLTNGVHRLEAWAENAYGVRGESLALDYRINAAVPAAPEVWPESGTYTSAQFVTLAPEEYTLAYYTTDGSLPTMAATLYEGPIPLPLGESHFRFVAYSDQEIAGKITERRYLLNLKTGVSTEEAGLLLIQQLIREGLILDQNGALEGYYGVHRYFYAAPIKVENSHYYLFAEHYLENELNQATGRFFAVEVMEGSCFLAEAGEDGKYSLSEIKK